MTKTTLRHRNEDRWLELQLELTDLGTEGQVASIEPGSISIEALDTSASQYSDENWISGCISGAQYALRKCGNVFENGVRVLSLKGALKSDDIEAIAMAASICIFRICGNENHEDTGDWDILQ